jgi:colanic acid biosynthesis glycosyl transferase WcaI
VLAAQGHEVSVICSNSTYAGGSHDEEAPAVTVHRVPTLGFSHGRFARPLSYLSFLIGALWTGCRTPRADVVVTMTTPPMLFVIGAILQRLRGVRHFIWVMDLFPEAFVDVGVFKANSMVTRLLYRIADRAYARADGVITIGECMRSRLQGRGIPEHKLHVVENWADGKSIFPIARRRGGPLVLMYSGNMGLSHDIDTLLFAIESLKNDARFEFRFVGSGVGQTRVKEWCQQRGLENVTFFPYCSREQLSESLSEADIGLVTQRTECAGSVVPSKVYGLMAAGRPILYIGPQATTPSMIVGRFQCGWQVECGDGTGLVHLLEQLQAERDKIPLAGVRAREAFLKNYDMPQAAFRLGSLLGAELRATARVHVA